MSITRLNFDHDGEQDKQDPLKHYPFPPVEQALTEEDGANGLLAIGGDLRSGRLLSAYRQGIFPWNAEDEPILWWSPNPRAIIPLDKFHLSKSLIKRLKRNDYTVSTDTQCEKIIALCANTRESTWITSAMQNAYTLLHKQGYVHSIEVYSQTPTQEKHLIGGLYGVALGNAFFAESMFSLETNGSKIALCALVDILKEKKYTLLDCQFLTPHLSKFGAVNIDRAEYLNQLNKAIHTQNQSNDGKKWSTSWHYKPLK